ncbi:hypothetical protein tinsulaeT_20750 [Thalassotalea insulae]|uniref:Uncharacterized protein n=1 Tax=Thalassotalea insulae TaxID=2056778 RepID=A0ABQ6GS10_9GAMM|nr:hypothetical protein [Thalassotalea insulae]GLX78735.1 hypothetical protein tinsulaeT_20750 [Thalassotalea insulae]
MKKWMTFGAFFLCTGAMAFEPVITNVQVNVDVVIFTVSEARSQNLASCVSTDNQDKWAFSLATAEGKNLYRALLHAHASQKIVEIAGTGDCSAHAGVERPQAIAVALL